jgi:hypothetical protein
MNAWGVVLGLIPVALGGCLALNVAGCADQSAAFGASRPKPPPYVRGYVTGPNQIRVIGGVFVVIGLLAIGAALGLPVPK